MNKNDTLEHKASIKNGVSRLIFVGLSILLEVIVLILLVTKLNAYNEWIGMGTRLLAVILVLGIYSKHQTASMKMPWIILIMAFPVLGVVLFCMIGLNGGTRKMKERYKKVDASLLIHLDNNQQELVNLAKMDPEAFGIANYVQRFSSYPVYQNTEVTYFSQAAQGLEAQLKALAKAEQFIFMEYHAIEDKESWQQIEEVLVERAHAGVEVRVFYDDVGSIGFINTGFVKKLEALGIKCRVFNPVVPGLNLFLNNRDHRKITVIDGRVGFTGGYNLANEYFNVTHPYGEWKDTGIQLEGEAVKSLTIAFLEMWNAVKDSKKMDSELEEYLPRVPRSVEQLGFVQPYADSPLDDEHIGEEVYMSIVNQAREYCYFVTPYLIITDELSHALCLAAKRGVDVRIITPGIPDKKMVYSVTRSFYNALVRNGVQIYEWTPGFCHAKMSIADGRIATCGTINLDYRSLYHHFENGCLLYGCKAIQHIRQDFDETFKQCRNVTDQYRTGRSAVLRLGQLFLRLFAELL